MSDTGFVPILYLKAKCPHCLKLRLFLLEAGLSGDFAVEEFAPGDEREAAIRARLAGQRALVSFPTVEIAPGFYLAESDAIIARYARKAGIDPAACPVFQSYVTGVLPRMLELYGEVAALKKAIG